MRRVYMDCEVYRACLYVLSLGVLRAAYSHFPPYGEVGQPHSGAAQSTGSGIGTAITAEPDADNTTTIVEMMTTNEKLPVSMMKGYGAMLLKGYSTFCRCIETSRA
ncbi:hypothetical protein BGZ46_007842 [Entomortierella lignicola]|nr:hypothetical protein BGZ46_007842 [Entomortierella lignicola]